MREYNRALVFVEKEVHHNSSPIFYAHIYIYTYTYTYIYAFTIEMAAKKKKKREKSSFLVSNIEYLASRVFYFFYFFLFYTCLYLRRTVLSNRWFSSILILRNGCVSLTPAYPGRTDRAMGHLFPEDLVAWHREKMDALSPTTLGYLQSAHFWLGYLAI